MPNCFVADLSPRLPSIVPDLYDEIDSGDSNDEDEGSRSLLEMNRVWFHVCSCLYI